MKEVTICFSCLIKDGALDSLSELSSILHGLSTDGTHTIRKHKPASKEESKLLTQMLTVTQIGSIEAISLWERKLLNTPDDLEAKKGTHAKRGPCEVPMDIPKEE